MEYMKTMTYLILFLCQDKQREIMHFVTNHLHKIHACVYFLFSALFHANYNIEMQKKGRKKL